MKRQLAALFLGLVLCSLRMHAQTPVPLLFKSMTPPLSNLFYLDAIGLIAVSNNQDIQFWDVRSKAYYGVIQVVPPEDLYSRISLVEYVPSDNKIAVVWSELTIGPAGDTIFIDRFYLYDAITLVPDPGNTLEAGGMARLIRYKYGRTRQLPELKDAMAIYRYHYQEKSGRLLTISRKGDVHIYSRTKWEKMIATGARESHLIYPCKKETGFYVTDKFTGRLTEFSIRNGQPQPVLQLTYIPNAGSLYNYADAAFACSVTPLPTEDLICILDSVNRLRMLETADSHVIDYKMDPIKGIRYTVMAPNWSDSSVYGIVEAEAPPYQRISVYTNLKTGVINYFSAGITPYFSAASATGLKPVFRMVISGETETEVDLSTLTEKNISSFRVAFDEMIVLSGELENNYYQLIRDTGGREEIRVFKKDSAHSYLQYRQPLRLPPGELLAGIYPAGKWYISMKGLSPGSNQYQLSFYDSSGRVLQKIQCAYPVQLFSANKMRRQQVFSADGRYFMLKEILRIQSPMDSCRLRIFRTEDFSLLADHRFTEQTDFNSFNHFTAAFSGMNNGYFYVHCSSNPNGLYTQKLVYHSLAGATVQQQREVPLCIDGSCSAAYAIRSIKPNMDGKVILWNGFVPADRMMKREAFQFAIISSTETGQHFGGMNLPAMPELMGVLPFPGYFGFVYTDRIDFAQLGKPIPGPFLSIIPFMNEKTFELSMRYFAVDYEKQKPWYYEKTNNEDCISFRVGASSYRRRQFDLAFNRPDKVLNLVPGHDTLFTRLYQTAVAKRAERISDKLKNFSPAAMPVVELASTKYGKNGSLQITVSIQSPSPVTKFLVSINGNLSERKVNIPASGPLQAAKQRWDFTEVLTNGENIIELTAVTPDGKESLPLRFSQAHNSPGEKPDLHLLAISVSQYKGGLTQLPFAKKDGRDIATLFSRFKEDTLFRNIYIDTLFDEAVNMTAITGWIRNKKTTAPADHILLFYSGHGFLDSSLQLRLATSITDAAVPELNSLEYETLLHEMDQLPARKKLMLIDACQSGDFDRTGNLKRNTDTAQKKTDGEKGIILEHITARDNSFELMQNLFSFTEPGKGTVVLSASGGTQSAFEEEKYQNGYFTYALKEALGEGKATDAPGKQVFLFQLVKYLKQRVTEMSGGRQSPGLRMSNPDLNWQMR